VALLEKRRFLYNHSGDFPQVILIVPSHVPNTHHQAKMVRKPFIPTVFLLLFDVLSAKNDVNVPLAKKRRN
jgi:hypothetical protein